MNIRTAKLPKMSAINRSFLRNAMNKLAAAFTQLNNISLERFSDPQAVFFTLPQDNIGIWCGYEGNGNSGKNCDLEITNAIIRSAIHFLNKNQKIDQVPNELRACIHITNEIHSTGVIAHIPRFREFYQMIYPLREMLSQIPENDILPIFRALVIQNLEGYEAENFIKQKTNDEIKKPATQQPNRGFQRRAPKATDIELESSQKNITAFLKKYLGNNKISLNHLESWVQSKEHFQMIQSNLSNSAELFDLNSQQCSPQKGGTCLDHTVFNLFFTAVSGKPPEINGGNEITSEDLRLFTLNVTDNNRCSFVMDAIGMSRDELTRQGLYDSDDTRRQVKMDMQANLFIQKLLPARTITAANSSCLKSSADESEQKVIAINNLRAFATQLKEEYRKKSSILLFLCPRTKFNKATRLENLANEIEKSSGDWLLLVNRELLHMKNHPYQSMLSHRTIYLLENIRDGKAEKGIISSKASEQIWISSNEKRKFW